MSGWGGGAGPYNSPLMSQITRCPFCATSFKVVADQLRISQGWVRCGQCKEVFDASAHLVAFPPEVLLPPVSFDDARPSAVTKKHAGATVEEDAPPLAPHWTGGQEETPLAEPVASVMEVPRPTVPAFLAAQSGAALAGEALGRGSAVAWRTSLAPDDLHAVAPGRDGAGAPAAAPDVPPAVHVPGPAEHASPWADSRDPDDIPIPPVPDGADAARLVDVAPAVSALDIPQTPGAEKPPVSAPVPQEAVAAPGAQAWSAEDPVATGPQAALREAVAEPGPGDGEERPAAEPEVGFLIAARRKAFWNRPAVRALLGLLALMSVVALGLQIALHERSRIAALDARAGPWLLALCQPLRCEVAPYRQIGDVAIESASFNKARGDGYQLSLSMKSKAAIAVATPAVELTLTDAQDQPVLRRVLLPADMAAPAQLQPGGSWSTSVAVVVTTGGARVVGYRLLAFYP